MTADDTRTGGLARRRLFYAERCENLMQAMQLQAAVLRGIPAGGNEIRDVVARLLSERLPPDELERSFEKIDAVWAAWTRPTFSRRNRDSVELHARMALLASIEQASGFVQVARAVRALARWRLGRAIDEHDKALVAGPEAAAAAELLEGKPYRVWTIYGVEEISWDSDSAGVPGSEAAAEADLPRPEGLVQWLVTQNGYPDVAQRLTDDQAARLVEVWPKQAGRPRGGGTANWDVIRHTLVDLGLDSAHVQKEWEAFRRRNGLGRNTKAAPAQKRVARGTKRMRRSD
ncbi:MAG: hypothetical protein ACLP1X_10180 [Polyangiaceae bacterium]